MQNLRRMTEADAKFDECVQRKLKLAP